MVGGSKSIYRYDNPKNLVVFNSNVCTREDGKIWYGDIDVTLDIDKLKQLAQDLKKSVYVLYEMAGRFENSEKPDFNDFAAIVQPDGTLMSKVSEYVYVVDGIPYVKTEDELESLRSAHKPHLLNESDFEPIELPDLKTFKVTKKSDPMGQFQNYFVDKYGKEEATSIYRRLSVTSTYYKELEDLATRYAKKAHPGLHPVKLEQSVSWYMFEMSPGNFIDPQPWEDVKMGYLRKEENDSQD
jgi:hypothetical protein